MLHESWKHLDLIKPPKAERLPDIITVDEAKRLYEAGVSCDRAQIGAGPDATCEAADQADWGPYVDLAMADEESLAEVHDSAARLGVQVATIAGYNDFTSGRQSAEVPFVVWKISPLA